MNIYDEKTCRCALNRLFGFKPAVSAALVAHFGSAASVFAADRGSLPPGAAGYFSENGGISDKEYEISDREIKSLEKYGAEFIYSGQDGYPAILDECGDHPAGIYIKGDSKPGDIFSRDRIYISIVGTRDISSYGTEWCRRTVYALADTGADICIVSGLAIGCDICAHRAALECGLPTIAVIPSGIDNIYPFRHRRDADGIARRAGCAVVTDYPPGTAPLQINFIRRNRIIAGLSGSTLLIESKARGGGMITARLAFSYDRDVYAIPGRVDDTRSAGCNILIKEGIATPFISADTFIGDIGLRSAGVSKRHFNTGVEELSRKFSGRVTEEDIDTMADILLKIRSNRDIDIQTIADECNIGYPRALELLSYLQSDGIVSVDLMQRCSINIRNIV